MMETVSTNSSPDPKQPNYRPLSLTEVYKLRWYLRQNSPNTGSKRVWYKFVLDSLLHPFNLLLILLSIACALSGQYETMGIMLLMVLLSTVLRFYQEWKSQVAVESLMQYMATSVTVVRTDTVELQDTEYVVPNSELAPGDFVKLFPGDLVPADVEILTADNFYVNQAVLTGEVFPVVKHAGSPSHSTSQTTEVKDIAEKLEVKKIKSPSPRGIYCHMGDRLREVFGMSPNHRISVDGIDLEKEDRFEEINYSDLKRSNLCFMGSTVISGMATGRVLNTGQWTIFGKLAKHLTKQKPTNSFQFGVRRISWLFFLLMVCMVPVVLLLQGFLLKEWFDAVMFALSVAVGLTPVMLPMVVNTTLAKGAMEMIKRKCVVKQRDGIIIMGAVDVLCVDKTRTLSKNEFALVIHGDGKGRTSPRALLLGYLNSYYQACQKGSLDAAIKKFYQDNHDHAKISEQFRFVRIIPFDSTRRRVSVVVQTVESSVKTLICKGAVEEILGVCTSVLTEDGGNLTSVVHGHCGYEKMTELNVLRLESLHEKLCEDGLNVIAVALKVVTDDNICEKDETDMTFVGFLGFADPPKETTQETMQNLIEHNVTVKVLSGDSPLACKKFCKDIGLKANQVITGPEIDQLSQGSRGVPKVEILQRICQDHSVFAKLSPSQKSDIVKALKMNGHTVGFLGDGINDAPALAEADVGICVDTAVDICKEAADIILLEKDLRVIVDAVITGRKTFGNMLKYIVMGTSGNFGNVFSILVASAWLPFEPMASLHILVQNLLYDISQMAIPWDTMDPEFLVVPHQWNVRKIVRFMVVIGPWSSLFDIGTFMFLWFYFGIQTDNDIEQVRLFQSSWFCLGMVTQTLIVYVIRTPKIPFLESCPSKQLLGTTMAMMIVGIFLPHIPGINEVLTMVPLRWEMWPFMGVVCIVYFVVIQLAKLMYIKLFREWY